MREVVAASDEEVDVWYGEGPGNPRVSIQGDELVGEFEGGLGTNVKVPLLQYVPRAWVPYFIAAQSPEAARRTLHRLTEGNVTDLQRQHTARLETWMRAACMRSGPVGANRYRSKLHVTWIAHRAVLDRSMSRWAAQRLAPFLTAPAVVPPVAAPAMGVLGAAGVKMLPPPGGGGGDGGAPYEGRETRVFSPLEHERIRLACGLDPANYDAGRSPIYAVFLAEGRSMVKVEAVLQKFLAPAPDDWNPIRLYVSQELVRDMKDLKLGWDNENAHNTGHRGMSVSIRRPPSVGGSADEAPQDPRASRSGDVSVDGRCQGVGSRTGMLPRFLLRNADVIEEVHSPPHSALWSRMLSPHRGAGNLPSFGREGRGLRDHVSRIDCRDLVASLCGRQGVLQPPGSRPARIPIVFTQARHPRLLPSRFY